MMALLDDFYDEDELPPLFGDVTLVKKWERVGLLQGLSEHEKPIISYYFDIVLRFLVKNEEMAVMWKIGSNGKGDLEVHIFPIIRRLFSTGKLNPTLFGADANESINYHRELSDFLERTDTNLVKEFRMDEAFMKFIPKMIEDYINWHLLPKTLDTEIMLANCPDPESELIHWYCQTFDISKII